jgi:hypothetical protein
VCSGENRRFAVKRDFTRIRIRSRSAFGKSTLLELLVVSVFVVFDFIFCEDFGHGRDCSWWSYWSSS